MMIHTGWKKRDRRIGSCIGVCYQAYYQGGTGKDIERKTSCFFLEPNMPLYSDMLDVKTRSAERELEFITHKEVWSD